MDYFICILLLAIGILLVVKGGDWFVDAASWIAEALGIPIFIVGATIVSLATTLPEILVSSISAAEGSVDLAIGNAVGSVNANIALIMGISLVFIPAAFKRKDYVAKIVMLLAAIALLWGFSMMGALNIWMSVIILLVFIAFMVENLIMAKRHASLGGVAIEGNEIDVPANEVNADEGNAVAMDATGEAVAQKPLGVKGKISAAFDGFAEKVGLMKTVSFKRSGMVVTRKVVVKNIILFILGAGGIVGGAQLMSTYGAELARLANVPEAIIGVTILAVGTSLPELVTTITAIIKKKADLSVGNIIGANIIDISLILPLCSFISGGNLVSPAQALVLDFPFCLAVAGFALLPALAMGKFKRWQGMIMLMGYVVYITLLVLNTVGVVALW